MPKSTDLKGMPDLLIFIIKIETVIIFIKYNSEHLSTYTIKITVFLGKEEPVQHFASCFYNK
jgi:hypothetical protein